MCAAVFQTKARLDVVVRTKCTSYKQYPVNLSRRLRTISCLISFSLFVRAFGCQCVLTGRIPVLLLLSVHELKLPGLQPFGQRPLGANIIKRVYPELNLLLRMFILVFSRRCKSHRAWDRVFCVAFSVMKNLNIRLIFNEALSKDQS